jgi:hypothetical protein
MTYFYLIPRRLKRRNPDFTYRAFLRELWGMTSEDSFFIAVTQRFKRRIIYGRNLPYFTQD